MARAMSPIVVIGLLCAAGVALVAQNLLMVRLTEAASSVVITLLINSVVGLTLLLTVLLARNGLPGLAEAASLIRPWSVLPGLLGTFFVFAGILGYQRVGAATTIAVLVASQLVAGLAADWFKGEMGSMRPDASSLIGAALLIVGAFLIARERL